MNKKGFTLIELIIVITVLTILAAIAVVSFGIITDRANERVCETNLVNMEHIYQVQTYLEPSITKAAYFADIDEHLSDASCPSGGIYTLEVDTFTCSEHGDFLDEE